MAAVHAIALRGVAILCVAVSLRLAHIGVADIFLATAAFGLAAASELVTACRRQDEARVWVAEAILAAGLAYLAWFDLFALGHGFVMFVTLGLGVAAALIGSAV